MGAIFWVGPKTHWAKSADFPIRIKIRISKKILLLSVFQKGIFKDFC